ncbi:MAG: SulP family inorganic anion transporter [Candidatus Dependentiae bacterium]|nr:SulP family inorganic anion transporter [Candidatus Dependentiae bacterium]
MIFSIFTLSKLEKNWKSGLTVALVSIPLSISLAVASGVSPVAGIITAIWAGLIASLFGSSNYNIIGPTGALSGVIASYALAYGAEYVPALAIISGIFIFVAYFFKLERYLIFIPSSVIHGFTLGIACIICLNQMNFALGLQNIPKHEKFIKNVIESFKHIPETSGSTLVLFILFFVLLLLVRKVIPLIPGAIIISPLGILAGYMAERNIIPYYFQTLGNKFGEITPSLKKIPLFSLENHMVMPALVIAFVAIVETMLSAKIADGMTKTKHNTRKELFGLGLANIISGFTGGIPATAALARTALNVKAGATSRLSAFLTSLGIAGGSFLFLSYFSFMPMAVVAAILIYVAINMIEREHFERLFVHDKGNFVIAMLVALITVYEDPIIGVISGTIMALLLLVNQLAQSYYEITVHQPKADVKGNTDALQKNILMYAFKGKLVYINCQAHVVRFQTNFTQYNGIILSLADVYFIDLDGVDALEEIIELVQNRKQIIALVISGSQINAMLQRSKRIKDLTHKGLIFDSMPAALDYF